MAELDDEADTIWLSPEESTRPIDLTDHLDLGEDRYDVQRTLGAGGMGEVSLCRDRRIGRDVALKAVRADVESIPARRAFLAEARVQAQLEHPAIIPVYDIGLDEQGREYFTMRAIAGTTLAKVLARLRSNDAETHREFTLLRMLDVFRQVCLAVDYAHNKGVIHRDLKPSNVMLGEYGEVYVLDWGLAQTIGRPTEAQGDASSPVMGTPGYIAPEQTFVGGTIDRSVDLYSLGAILFEILSLQRLHVGRTSAEILESTRSGTPVHAHLRAPEREIPPELDAVCARATAFDPRSRQPTVRALIDEVDAFLEGHRNQSLRRDLAAQHAELAHERALQALGAGQEDAAHRKRALQEIARALALDPDNAAARRIFVRLISEPPREVPVEVEAELERSAASEGRYAMRLGALAYTTFAVISLITLFQGLRSYLGLAIVVGTIGAAALWSFRLTRRFAPKESLFVFVLSSVAISVASGFYGPLVLVPVLAGANATAFNLAIVRRYRPHIFVIGVLVFLVPALAEWLGVIPPFYVFEHGMMSLVPRFIEFNESLVRPALVVVNIAAVIAPALVVWRISDTRDELRRKYVLQSWQLRQLVAD